MDYSRTFGNPTTFAIRVGSYAGAPGGVAKMAYCHITFGGQLIGDTEESCYLPTWYFSLVRVKQRITQDKDSLFPSEFKGLSQREIFEIILKIKSIRERVPSGFSSFAATTTIPLRFFIKTIDAVIEFLLKEHPYLA